MRCSLHQIIIDGVHGNVLRLPTLTCMIAVTYVLPKAKNGYDSGDLFCDIPHSCCREDHMHDKLQCVVMYLSSESLMSP
jgi:hypothetical protein